MSIFIMLDVGGTEIKGGVFDVSGALLGGIRNFQAKAGENPDTIFENFCHIISDLGGGFPKEKLEGIGMAFPGPFDYEQGISLMRGLNKYDQIYGMRIPEELRKRSRKLERVKILFRHDVEAFARGVYRFGMKKQQEKVLCLCIGTGAGSAFLENGEALKKKTEAVPENGWIYNSAFRDSILDDYLSVRGLKRLSREIMGEEMDGKRLSELCSEKNPGALKVYREFGKILYEGILPFLDSFKPQALILGGLIIKSFPYFGEKLEKACKERSITLIMEENTSLRAMQGLLF